MPRMSNTFSIGRTVHNPKRKIINSRVLGIGEKIASFIPNPLDEVPSGHMVILNGKLWTNPTSGILIVPDPIKDNELEAIGFSNVAQSSEGLAGMIKLEAKPGSIISPSQSCLVEGILYVNRSGSALIVPTDTSEESMIAAGLSVNTDSSHLTDIKNALVEMDAEVGDVIPSGESRFINGVVWSNISTQDIPITSTIPEILRLSSLVRIGLGESSEIVTAGGIVPAGQLRFIDGSLWKNPTSVSISLPLINTPIGLSTVGLVEYKDLSSELAIVAKVGDEIPAGKTFSYNGILFINDTNNDITIPVDANTTSLVLAGFTLPEHMDTLNKLDSKLKDIVAELGSVIEPGKLTIISGKLFYNNTQDDIQLSSINLSEALAISAGLTLFDLVSVGELSGELHELNANAGDTVTAGRILFVDGRLYTNSSGTDVTLPTDTSVDSLFALGLEIFSPSATNNVLSELGELNANVGDEIGVGKTKYINGVLYANPTTNVINITSVDEADLLASGLKPLSYELINENTEALDTVIASVGEDVPAFQTRFIQGEIWINPNNSSIEVEVGDDKPSLKNKGLIPLTELIDGKADKEEVDEFNVNAGSTIAPGETRFVDGSLYTNVTSNAIVVPANTDATNLTSLGLVKYSGEASDGSVPQSYLDDLFLNN